MTLPGALKTAKKHRIRLFYTGLCALSGCGVVFWTFKRTQTFCSLTCLGKGRTGALNPCYKGGSVNGSGYLLVYHQGRRDYQHRVVMEQKLGRRLEAHEQVHHRDGDRLNNAPDNLELWIRPQPTGSRLRDVVRFLVEKYPDAVRRELQAREAKDKRF